MYEVVVLPCVPETANTFLFLRISPSISGPDLNGRRLFNICSTDSFPLDKALPITYKSASGRSSSA